MINRAVFAAGGTGGHIFPAIAVADELKKLNDRIEIYFIGAKGRMEEKIVPECGYQLLTIEIQGFRRSISPKNIGVIFKLLSSTKKVKKFLTEFKPQIVFGTGGYVSGPVLRASCKLGIPSVLYEGNYYPGLTVKALAPKVDKLILNFDGSRKFFMKQSNIAVMPYPVRANFKHYSREEAVNFFGLDPAKKILFTFGGSQGANSINKALLECCDELLSNGIQLIWQTGKNDYKSISEKIGKRDGIKLFEFINTMDYAYSAADLVVCRSGISTMMEAAYFGSAVVFVPYAFATDNHQEKNAKAMVDANASEMILDKELGEKFKSEVVKIINDPDKLSSMRENIKRFADKDAALNIAKSLFKYSEISKN